MPALNAIGDKLKADQTFKGKTICVSVHLEAKTAYLAEVLHRAGANVIVTGSNPLSTQDDVAAALVEDGLTVYAWYGATDEEYFDFLNKSLDHHPDIIIDDGGDQVHLLHTTRPMPWKTSSAARKKRRLASTVSTVSTKPAN
mgnify:FL=1